MAGLPALLAFQIPSWPTFLLIGAVGLIALAAASQNLDLSARVAVVGGWGLFALTSPSAQFPQVLRPVSNAIFTIGIALLLYLRPSRRDPNRPIAISTKLLVAYCAFVLVGCLASPLGPKNLVRGVQGILIVMTGYYGVAFALANQLLIATWVACLANVILTVISRQQEVDALGNPTGRLAGYMQPNHLAYTAAEVLLGVMVMWPRDLKLSLPFFGRVSAKFPLAIAAAISLYALFASRSRTGWIGVVAAIGIAGFSSIPTKAIRTRVVVWTVAAMVVVLPVAGPSILSYLNRDNSAQSITSLTGRTEFWPLAVGLIERRPFVGWGVNVILSPVGAAFQKVLPGVGQAHNAILEAALQAGVIGAAAWTLSVIALIIGSFRLDRSDPYRTPLIAGSILTAFFALTESSPAWFGDMFIVYVFCAAIYGDRLPTMERVRWRMTRLPRWELA